MHVQAYRHLNVTVRGFDIIDGPISEVDILSINWPDVIVDVCTPTSTHVESLTWAYALGARKFILEKPPARSNNEWRRVLPTAAGCADIRCAAPPLLKSVSVRRESCFRRR
jgi:hypothetical protein